MNLPVSGLEWSLEFPEKCQFFRQKRRFLGKKKLVLKNSKFLDFSGYNSVVFEDFFFLGWSFFGLEFLGKCLK